MFLYLKDENKHVYIPFDSDTVRPGLDKGIYNVTDINGYKFFTPNKAFDKGKLAKAGIFGQVYDYTMRYFSDNGKLVRSQMGQATRLGLFFKGDPGTGKTFLAARLAIELIEKENGVVIYSNQLRNFNMTEIVDCIRSKDKDRLVVFILDEFEKDYDRLSQPSRDSLLAFLDGGNSRDNILVIATANSLDGIPPTLLERPGRFEKVLEFSIKDTEVRDNIILNLIPSEYEGVIDSKEIISYVNRLPIKSITIDKLKSIVRDALVNFLDTGYLFSEYELENIPKEQLALEMGKTKKKAKKPKSPWEYLKEVQKRHEESEEEEYVYDEDEDD